MTQDNLNTQHGSDAARLETIRWRLDRFVKPNKWADSSYPHEAPNDVAWLLRIVDRLRADLAAAHERVTALEAQNAALRKPADPNAAKRADELQIGDILEFGAIVTAIDSDEAFIYISSTAMERQKFPPHFLFNVTGYTPAAPSEPPVTSDTTDWGALPIDGIFRAPRIAQRDSSEALIHDSQREYTAEPPAALPPEAGEQQYCPRCGKPLTWLSALRLWMAICEDENCGWDQTQDAPAMAKPSAKPAVKPLTIGMIDVLWRLEDGETLYPDDINAHTLHTLFRRELVVMPYAQDELELTDAGRRAAQEARS